MSSTFSLQTFRRMTHSNPWASLWLAPRRTIRTILDENPTYWVWPLAVLGGVVQAMEQAMVSALGEHFSFAVMMLLIVLGGGLLGLVTLYFFSFLLAWTGRWLEGQATARELRVPLAWSNLPLGLELVVMLLLIQPLWATVFTGHSPTTQTELMQLGIVGVVRLVGGIWALVLLLLGIAETQRFAVWKAIANLLMVLLIYFALGFVLLPGLMALILLLTNYLTQLAG